jgi:hypothetical protein
MPSKNNRNSHRQSHKQSNIYNQTLLDGSPSPLSVTPFVDRTPNNEQLLIPIEPPPLHLDPEFDTEEPQDKNVTETETEADTLDLFDPTPQCTPELVDTRVHDEPAPFQSPSRPRASSRLEGHNQGHTRSPILSR